MFERLKRFYEEDSGTNPIVAAPGAVTEVVKEVPATTIKVGQDVGELPQAAIQSTLDMLNSSISLLTSAVNEARDEIKRQKEVVEDIVETPMEGAGDVAEDIAPEITEPPPRYVRRNGRRVRR